MQNQLVKNLHETAKSKGWWEKPRESAELKTLIISELIEAFEEVRKGTPMFYVDHCGIKEIKDADPENYIVLFSDNMDTRGEVQRKMLKPEGEAIELADAWIRCADWLGFLKGDYEELKSKIKCKFADDTSVPQMYHDAIGSLFAAPYAPIEFKLVATMMIIEDICRLRGFDLNQVLILKDAYNKTRAYRHGGKKY